jgi:hypothetical protein
MRRMMLVDRSYVDAAEIWGILAFDEKMDGVTGPIRRIRPRVVVMVGSRIALAEEFDDMRAALDRRNELYSRWIELAQESAESPGEPGYLNTESE